MMRFFILLSTVTAFSISPTTVSSSTSSTSSKTISIWDNVLSTEEQRATLHAYASQSGLEHKCFSRPLADTDNDTTADDTTVDADGSGNHITNNIIERTLDAILTQLDNDATKSKKQYVEYWTRQEWRHIEAHADVDENLSKRMDQTQKNSPPSDNDDDNDDDSHSNKFPSTFQKSNGHRYPTYGHVLYLQVGSEVQGPTCVFPRRSSGGDLLKSLPTDNELNSDSDECKSNRGEGHDEGSDVNSSGSSEGDYDGTTKEKEEVEEEGVRLVTVPAVPGRLLRFDGRDLHAVPRPHDIWMLPFVKGGAQYEPEDEWGRSVILFNVWPGEEDPPLDVPLDSGSRSRSGKGKEDVHYSKEDGQTPHEDESREFCTPFANWKEMQVHRIDPTAFSSTSNAEPNQSVKVWLLGNERRREHPMRTVPLLSPAEGGRDAVRRALAEQSRVTELWLRRP